jgi:hypothetical protein
MNELFRCLHLHGLLSLRSPLLTTEAAPALGREHENHSSPAFRMAFPNLVIRSDELARAMVDVVVQRTDERQSCVFENRDIKALAHTSAIA